MSTPLAIVVAGKTRTTTALLCSSGHHKSRHLQGGSDTGLRVRQSECEPPHTPCGRRFSCNFRIAAERLSGSATRCYSAPSGLRGLSQGLRGSLTITLAVIAGETTHMVEPPLRRDGSDPFFPLGL